MPPTSTGSNRGVRVMKVSVVAGNEGALRFYRREGATDFLQTLIVAVEGA
jgi:hypothetical protein